MSRLPTGTLCIGTLVPRQFLAPVVSVHHREGAVVVNLALEDSRGRHLLSLITRKEDLTAGAILLPGNRETTLQLQNLHPGDVVQRTGTLLHLTPGSSPVSLADHRQWAGTLEDSVRFPAVLEKRVSSGRVAHAIEKNSRWHRGLGMLFAPRDHQEDPWLRRARETLGGSRSVFPHGLIGLGPGFTPAGDDFCTGLLLARQLGNTPLSSSEREAILERLPGTTAGGATILRHALSCSFPFYLTEICAILANPDSDPEHCSLAAWEKAAQHGHSSGIDALAGLLWGLGETAASEFPVQRYTEEKRG